LDIQKYLNWLAWINVNSHKLADNHQFFICTLVQVVYSSLDSSGQPPQHPNPQGTAVKKVLFFLALLALCMFLSAHASQTGAPDTVPTEITAAQR
jgi:hypothetical protein